MLLLRLLVQQGELLGGEYELATARPLLATLLQLDKQRLLTWLTQQQQGQNSELALALFETLGFGYYLDDQQLCSVVIEQLNALDWQLDTDGQDSRFAGFYKLLAHPDGAVRAKVQSAPCSRKMICTHQCYKVSLRHAAGQITSPAS